MGICIHPSKSDMILWSYADFRINWFPEESKDDSDTARSCSGFVVSYLGCPVMRKLHFHTEISLIYTDSDYISLSQALRKTIPIIDILK